LPTVYKSINTGPRFESLGAQLESFKVFAVLVWFMKAGKPVKAFTAKDGHKVLLRTFRWEDLDDLQEVINSLVEEKAEITRTEKVSREEEIDWFSGALGRLEKNQTFYLVAEVDGHVVANSEINRRSGSEKHVGGIGIAIKNGFRDIGVGTEMMNALVEQARKMGLKVLTLTCFATNKRAMHVYEKVGFVQTGRIPKKHFREGEYVDEIIMTELLE
jgi:RimJ/RimL family protein N-acetyltransferase